MTNNGSSYTPRNLGLAIRAGTVVSWCHQGAGSLFFPVLQSSVSFFAHESIMVAKSPGIMSSFQATKGWKRNIAAESVSTDAQHYSSCLFFSVHLNIFNWRIVLYNIVLVLVEQHHESDITLSIYTYIYIHTYIWASWASVPPHSLSRLSRLSQSIWPGYLTHGTVHRSRLLSQFFPPSSSLSVQRSVLCICVSISSLKLCSSVLFF